MLQANLGAVNSKTVTVNKDVWESLPAEVQTVLQDVAVAYRDHVAEVAMTRAADSLEKFTAAGGAVVELSAEERAVWAESMPNIAVEWAKELDANGAPGSDMLIAYIEKLKAAGQEPARDWAAELSN